ncbi:MAG: hypothetical protein ACXWQO_19955 [Bdellovibrionota bacterium]
MKTILILVVALGAANVAYGFGSKKMNFTEVKGQSEAQVVQGENLNVMIRGRAAELFYKVNMAKATEIKESAAIPMMKAKDTTHWAWTGKQITCSKVTDTKKNKDEYACGFAFDASGVMAGIEPFTPTIFNLAQTQEKTTLFKKMKKSRGLASAAPGALDKATAFVVYDKPREATNSKEAMVVIRGKAAQDILTYLATDPKAEKFKKGPAEGLRGKEIACVYASGTENERCSFMVSMDDGSVSKSHNPLFH